MGSGLLKKANLLSSQKGLAFSNFIQKNSSKTFAIFNKFNNFYFITNSLGFDGVSILSSYSTSDFWNGLISSKNKIYNFTQQDNTLNKMLQFFSFDMKDKISSVSVYLTNDKIILLCNEELTNDFIHDVNILKDEDKTFDISRIDQNLVSKYNLNKYTINYIEAVESYVEFKAKNKSEISDCFKNALLQEISNRLQIYFNIPNCTVTVKEYYNNLILFSKDKLQDELLLNHLILNMKEIIENCAELLEINFIGKAESYNEIIEFLKVE